MCHMWADHPAELFSMVDQIGVARKWLQQPPRASWVHFDISKKKRSLAVRFGAIETDEFQPLIHCGFMAILDGKQDYGLARIRSAVRAREKHSSYRVDMERNEA